MLVLHGLVLLEHKSNRRQKTFSKLSITSAALDAATGIAAHPSLPHLVFILILPVLSISSRLSHSNINSEKSNVITQYKIIQYCLLRKHTHNCFVFQYVASLSSTLS